MIDRSDIDHRRKWRQIHYDIIKVCTELIKKLFGCLSSKYLTDMKKRSFLHRWEKNKIRGWIFPDSLV